MYKAVISRVEVTPHPNADFIAVGRVSGHTVVVSKQTPSGELGIFFPADGQLSDSFCKANGLYPIYGENGEKIGGGFFDVNTRRIRAQSFRGVKSEGFWIPLASVHKWHKYIVDANTHAREEVDTLVDLAALNKLKEGDFIDSIGALSLCEKYETPATKRAKNQGSTGVARKAHPLFFKHVDTGQLKSSIGSIPAGSLITISEKLHGTSGRYTKQVVPLDEPVYKFPWTPVYKLFKWLLKFLILENFFKREGLKVLVGSRNIELENSSDKFRMDTAFSLSFNLEVGETVYGELVGYNGQTPIMGRHSIDKSSNPALKKYGKTFAYSYGCEPGSFRFYIYRITMVSPSHRVVELTPAQMLRRSKELGFDCVPQFDQFVYTGDKQDLLDRVSKYVDGDSTLDSRHLREGVVIRVDSPDGYTSFLKEKSFDFKVLEGMAKDSADYVDTEEIS